MCIYLKQTVFGDFRVLPLDIVIPNRESLWLQLRGQSFTFTITVVYRPPSSSTVLDPADAALFEIIESTSQSCPNWILTGDFNFPTVDWASLAPSDGTDVASGFVNTLLSTSMTQHVTQPTRYRLNQEPSLLDLVFSNQPDLISNLKYSPPIGISDHVTITFSSQFITYHTPRTTIKNHIVTDFDRVAQLLHNQSWDSMHRLSNINEKWKFFTSTLEAAVKKASRLKQTKHSTKKPWITEPLLSRIKFKRRLWQKYRVSKSAIDFERHRTFSNLLTQDLRQAKAHYENNLLVRGPKSVYGYVRRNLSTRVSSPLVRNSVGELCMDDLECANTLAEHFELSYSQEPPGNPPQVATTRNSESLNTIHFDEEDILRHLQGLKADSAPGPDGISNRLLKNCAIVLAGPLSHLFTHSLSTATLPKDWLTAVCTPVYKKGDKLDPNNYRQISLLSTCLKVMERLIVSKITDFALRCNILPSTQHGFLPGRSTVTNLLACLDNWTTSLDRGHPVDVIYLDFSKAFDKVPKHRLLAKLQHLGLRGPLLGWISAYLSNRTFTVRVNQARSRHHLVQSGVPQGSSLGPILFNLYVADLHTHLQSNHAFYADDSKIFGNPLTEHDSLQDDLSSIEEWCRQWLIPVNVSKCTVLHLGGNNPQLDYHVANHLLKSVERQVDLGVMVSSSLKWTDHVSRIVKKANSTVYMLRSTFRSPTPELFRKLYTSFVRPLLEYAAVIWSPNLAKDIQLLEGVQRRATKAVKGFNTLPYEERLARLNLPHLVTRRKRGDLIYTYRILNDHLSADLTNLFELNTDTRLRGHSLKLTHEKFRTNFRQCFFSNRVFSTWNGLTDEVVAASNVNSFKNKLDHLVSLGYML